MSSSSSSNQTTADGSIGSSSTEYNKTSGNPIDEPFRKNKKASKRSVAKITRQSPTAPNQSKTAAKYDPSNVKNKHTKQSEMSSSSPSNQTTADGSIGTSSTEYKNTSGDPIDEPFMTNKKASKRAVTKITRQPSLSLVNMFDNSAAKTNLKMDSFKFSLRGNVPEHSVGTIASPFKESTSSNDHFVLPGSTQNPRQFSLRNKHPSKISRKNYFRELPPRFKRGNAHSLAGHFHKHQKNNFVLHQHRSSKSSNDHAGDSTRNLGSREAMGRTNKSHDNSQTAMHCKNDCLLEHSPRTNLSSKSSNISFTSNGHSPKALHDYIEAKCSNSSSGSFDSNYGLRLYATTDPSTESNERLSSHTTHPASFTHSPVDFEDSYSQHYGREQLFCNSRGWTGFGSNYGLRPYATTDSSEESNEKLSSHTTYSPRSTHSPVDSEDSYSRQNGSEQWFRNSGESRIDLTSNYRHSPKASDNVQCSPSNVYFPICSGKSAESNQGHGQFQPLEDMISDIECSFRTINFSEDQSTKSHEGRGQSPTALDDVIPQPECLPKTLYSPIGSGRRAQLHVDHSIKPSGNCDNSQSRKMKGELEGHVHIDGKEIKLRLRNCDVSNPETLPKDLEENISSSTNQPQKTEESKYEIKGTTDISHTQNNNASYNWPHSTAKVQKVTSEGNSHSRHASSPPNVLDIITENARALNVPQINPNEPQFSQPWPNEPQVSQPWTNAQQDPEPWLNKSHVPSPFPYNPHVPPPLPYNPHVPPPLPYNPHVPPPRPYAPHVSPSRPYAPHVSPSRSYVAHVSPSRSYVAHVSPSRPYVAHVWPYVAHVSPSRPYTPNVPPYPYDPHVPPPRLHVPHVLQICLNNSDVSQPSLDNPPLSQPTLDELFVSQPSQD